MVEKQMINRREEHWGNKTIFKYSIAEKGRTLLEDILQKYEELFPREGSE